MAEIRFMRQHGYIPAGEGKWMDANTGEIASDREIEKMLSFLQEKEALKAKYQSDLTAAENIAYDQGRIAETRDEQLKSALVGQENLSNALQQAEDRADGLTGALDDELVARDLAQKQYQGAKEVLAQVLPETPPVFSMPQENSLKVLNNLMNQAQIEDAAINAIRGVFGNGQARKDALGDNYKAVQARVNEILAGK